MDDSSPYEKKENPVLISDDLKSLRNLTNLTAFPLVLKAGISKGEKSVSRF